MFLYFVLNNIYFALETFGALAFLMVAWLAFDSLSIRRDFLTASRAIGFLFLAVWQIFHAFQFSDNNLQYIGYGAYFLGLIFVLLNLSLEIPVERPEFKAILPPIAAIALTFDSIATGLLFLISLLAYRQYLKEQKVAIRLFAFGFSALTLASFVSLFYDHDTFNILWGFQHLFEFVGFYLIIWWVWQYLQLRIREELVMIFFSGALFISLIATLVFSMINAARVESLTADSLTNEAKLFNLSISNLEDSVLSKTALLAKDDKLNQAFNKSTVSAANQDLDSLASGMALKSLLVVDRVGSSLSSAFSTPVGRDLSGQMIVQQALAGKPIASIAYEPGGDLLINSSAPIQRDGKTIGAVLAGFPLDSAFVDSVNRVTGLQLSIYYGDTVAASTAFDNQPDRVGVKETNPDVLRQVLQGGQALTTQVLLGSKPYISVYLPILDYQNKPVGMISVSRSEHEILDISNQTNRLTLVTILVIMLILITPFYFLTKRLSEESY